MTQTSNEEGKALNPNEYWQKRLDSGFDHRLVDGLRFGVQQNKFLYETKPREFIS